MDIDALQEAALAAGATQLGEAGTIHFILSVEQLAAFARLVAAPLATQLPQPPY